MLPVRTGGAGGAVMLPVRTGGAGGAVMLPVRTGAGGGRGLSGSLVWICCVGTEGGFGGAEDPCCLTAVLGLRGRGGGGAFFGGGAGFGGKGFRTPLAGDGAAIAGLGGGARGVESLDSSAFASAADCLPLKSSTLSERCLFGGGGLSTSSSSSRFGEDRWGDVRTNIASPSSTESKESWGGDPGGVLGLPTTEPKPPCCIDGACE